MIAASADDAKLTELADRLRPTVLKLSRHLRREAQKVGLSAIDAQLLGMIKFLPGAGVSDLADLEQMSRPAMSAHVKRLETSGWLTRQAEPPGGDKRRVGLLLTPEGLQVLEAIRRSRNDWLCARLGFLTSEQRAVLEAALEPLARLVEVKA